MIASARNMYILNRLHECSIVDYKSIARELGVSEATIRRDFEKLEKNGKLRRVQGGAIWNDNLGAEYGVELSMRAKHTLNSDAKILVAKAAAQEVEDGDSVFLDMGTSIEPIAEILLNKAIRIVTNSNLVLQHAGPASLAKVYCVGGQFMPADHIFVGPMAENMLNDFGFNHAFIGCMGFNVVNNAAYVTDMESLRIKQIAMHNAKHNILLLDSSKENKIGLFRLAGLERFEKIFIEDDGTEHGYPDNFHVIGHKK